LKKPGALSIYALTACGPKKSGGGVYSGQRETGECAMTTVTIDDALASHLRTLRGTDDLNAVVAEALAKTVRDWEREAQGRAEMQAMLDGPRHTLAEVDARIRQKHGYPDLSHLTREQIAEEAEQVIAAMDPQVRTEMEREGWL